jgi:hypothetical protein
MIDPQGIPQYTGQPDSIISEADAARTAAQSFAATGQSVNGAWQGLGPLYVAPESGQLLAAMQPVADRSATLATEVAAVADALTSFAGTMAPIKSRLAALQLEALTFVHSVAGDDDWQDDGDKVDRHNALQHEVAELVARWQEAERTCANAIIAASGGTWRYVADNGDEDLDPHEYGYTLGTYEAADEAGVELPWGTSETENPGILGNITGFFQGVFVDGAWGDVDGLLGLVGVHGWDTFRDGWTNIGILGVSLSPTGVLLRATDPDFQERSDQLMSALVGDMLATDMWSENGGRAFGQVLWNFGSLAAGGVGAAGKAGKLGRLGAVAERLSAGARLPVTSLFDRLGLSGAGLARLDDLMGDLDTRLDVPQRIDLDLPERFDVDGPRPVDAHVPAHVDVPSTHDLPSGPSTGTDGHSPTGADGHSGTSPDGPAVTPEPRTEPGGGPPHQAFEDPLPSYGPDGAPYSEGTHPISAEHPGIEVPDTWTRNQRGELGDALTKLELERQGYTNLVTEPYIRLSDGRYFKPDFLATGPDGNIVAVESKFGDGAKYTPGQLTGYAEMKDPAHVLEPASRRTDILFESNEYLGGHVHSVVVYRWNTEVVPDLDTLAEAIGRSPRLRSLPAPTIPVP